MLCQAVIMLSQAVIMLSLASLGVAANTTLMLLIGNCCPSKYSTYFFPPNQSL